MIDNHCTEHQLDLFLRLPEQLTEEERSEIRAHVAGCRLCEGHLETLRTFYADLGDRLQQDPSERDSLFAEKLLAKKSSRLLPSRGELRRTIRGVEKKPFEVAIYDAPLRPIQRFQRFVRHHPIATGGASFALVAAVVAILSLVLTSSPRDKNPSYTKLNPQQNTLEVYNRNDEKLWQLPVENAKGFRADEINRQTEFSHVADLDGDGKNEVITVLPGLGSKSQKTDVLHIFTGDKTLHREIKLGGQVHFLDTSYADYFTASLLLVDDFSGNGTKEIIAQAINIHSPCVISRFDAQGNLIGEYWHFGYVTGINSVDLDKDGRKEIVCCGVNDAQGHNGKYGVIVVLDPTEIVGKLESCRTPGFGFAPSRAELYYIRLPVSDIEKAGNAVGGPHYMTVIPYENQDVLSVWYESAPEAAIEYILSGQMRVLAVNTSSGWEQLHADLVQQGKVTGKIDKHYLENLKAGVRYWDGKEWSKEVVRVRHGNVR